MIEVVAQGNAGLMAGLLDKMSQGGASRLRLYNGVRSAASATPPGPLITMVLLHEPAGSIDTNGDLVLQPGVESVLLLGAAPTWGKAYNGNEQHLFDFDARVSTAPNTGQELVIEAPAGMYPGALVRVLSGSFSALP